MKNHTKVTVNDYSLVKRQKVVNNQIAEADYVFMAQALALADKAAAEGEVPVGAVLVLNNQVLASGWNQPVSSNDPTGHAEIMALRNAARVMANYRLPDTTLYVTIEPCTMCIGAIIHARVKRLVFGALEPRAGAVCSQLNLLEANHYNHRVEWCGGVMADQCGEKMSLFFKERRKTKS